MLPSVLAQRIPSDNISIHSQTGATYNSIIYLMFHRLQDNIKHTFVHHIVQTYAFIDLSQ